MARSMRSRRWPTTRRGWQEMAAFYAFIAPWLLGFLGLSAFPLLVGLLTSFTNYDGLNLATLKWVGLANYERALNDRLMWHSLGRVLYFTALNVPISLLTAFVLAVVMNQPIRARGLWRTLFYLPSIIPIVAVAWIWKSLLDANIGLVNSLIRLVAPDLAIRWMLDFPTQSLMLLALWMGVGGTTLTFLAGLQNIPRDLEEAARIDGANRVQTFAAITLPLLTPVIFFQLVLGLIFSLQLLVEPILLSGSRISDVPPRPNYVYMVHVFNVTFARQLYGYGAALSWILFVIILLLTLIIFRTSRYWVHYEYEQEITRL